MKHNGLAMRSVPKGIAYRCCVCPAWALGIEDTEIIPEGVSPLCAGVVSGSISKSQGG